MKDVLGEALTDFHRKGRASRLWVNNRYGLKEEMLIKVYFRDAEEMPELEWIALQQCSGRILDIGAGAGSHALVLQRMGLEVTALDLSPRAVAVMKDRGVERVVVGDFFEMAEVCGDGEATGEKGGVTASGQTDGWFAEGGHGLAAASFDTLLLLMNGIGLAGTIDGLRRFLVLARRLLRPGGKLVFDSSDIAYLYEGQPPVGGVYYGEILYQYEYKREKSEWFHWLFIDRTTLGAIAAEMGWRMELLHEDKWGQYLVIFRVG